MPYLTLTFAIFTEVIATTALKASEGFTKGGPSTIVIVGYSLSFYFLSRTLQHLPIGLVYAVWSGLGIVLVALVGWVIYGQRIDAWGAVGFALIVAGVVVLNTLSSTEVH